jgi:Uma2 family endonuclease
MVRISAQSLTLEEFLELPETEPASEYIDGKIIQKPMPQGKHSVIQSELTTALNAYLKRQRIARAFPELRCTFGGFSIVPDIAVLVWDRIPREANGEIANVFPVAPDWIIEILSTNQSQTKVTKKILRCLQYGTQLGWLVDPGEKTVFAYDSAQKMQVFDNAAQQLPVPDFASEFQLTIGELFSWLFE